MAVVAATSIAVPQGMIVVDHSGKRHYNKTTLAEGDRLAHPPAIDLEHGDKKLFGGTIPVYAPDPKLSREENQRKYVDWLIEQERNRKTLLEAVFYLSQSQRGRALLYDMRRRGFAFVFDRRRTEERAAAGLCDFENKLVPLNPNTHPVQLMLTVDHELDHMDVMGKGLHWNASHTLKSATIVSRALEASARVEEACTAFGFEQAPPHFFRPAGVADFFTWKLPHMAAAARQAIKQGHRPGSDEFKRAAFLAFYKEEKALAYYDKDTLTSFEKDLAGLQAVADLEERAISLSIFMVGETPQHEKITGIMPYLHDVPDLDDARYAKLKPEQEIKDRHAALTQGLTDALNGADASSRVAVSFDEPEPVKRGMLAIAAATLVKWGVPAGRAAKQAAPAVTVDTWTAASEAPRTIAMPSQPGLKNAGDADVRLTKLAKDVASMAAYTNPNDIVQLALMAPVYHMNRQGYVREAIGLGLRAPIRSFPQEYLMHVLGTLDVAGKKQGVVMEPADIAILAHWKMLAANGIDPVHGGHKDDMRVDDNNPWAKELAKVIGNIAPASGKVQNAGRDELMQWAREHANPATRRAPAPSGIRANDHSRR